MKGHDGAVGTRTPTSCESTRRTSGATARLGLRSAGCGALLAEVLLVPVYSSAHAQRVGRERRDYVLTL